MGSFLNCFLLPMSRQPPGDLVPCTQAPAHPPPSPTDALNQCISASQRHWPSIPAICIHPAQVLTLVFLGQERQPLCLKDRTQARYPKDKGPFLGPLPLLSVLPGAQAIRRVPVPRGQSICLILQRAPMCPSVTRVDSHIPAAVRVFAFVGFWVLLLPRPL